ncbi:MAG TPA: hypothetical protein V6D27_10600 [Vampirovibrionales bacterium]
MEYHLRPGGDAGDLDRFLSRYWLQSQRRSHCVDRQGEVTVISSSFRICKAIATGFGLGSPEQP